MSVQPFRGDQEIVLERRHPDGTLDFCGEQPPSFPCRCCGPSSPGVMKFQHVYDLYFRYATDPAPRGTSASYEELAAWLKRKGWTIRAKTW